jgi:hypothetical protein
MLILGQAGWSPLTYAMHRRRFHLCQALLSGGAAWGELEADSLVG